MSANPISAWRVAVLVLAAAPLMYYLFATIAALRFFRREPAKKGGSFAPAVSVLKPVRGVDFGSYENFASFCQQEYPEYEILFAVNDSGDPAVPLIKRLSAEFPSCRIRLLVGAEQLGANRKVNKLARLAREAQHEFLAVTDGDVRVGENYLREVVGPLANESVGAVTSFYRSIAERNLWAELEAVGASSDFFAGVLLAEWMEGMSFALGASVVTSKRWLREIGGFEAIADMHSDDYELGNRIARTGGKLVLSQETVWTMYPARTFAEFWAHQVRWARTVRLCRPFSYLGLLFTHGLPWAVLAGVVAPNAWLAATFLLAYLVLRLMTAWAVGVRGVADDTLRKRLWLLPLRDAVYFVVWLASFGSNRITWGSEQFFMDKGRMVPADSLKSSNPTGQEVQK